MERGLESARREAKDQIPGDKVKDASALSRELRWRVRLASGYGSDGEDVERQRGKTTVPGDTATGQKRKRGGDVESLLGTHQKPTFRHFEPKIWERSEESQEESTKRSRVRHPLASGEDWVDGWMDWAEEVMTSEEGEEVEVGRARKVVVRVRRTERGLERQRVERLTEDWQWL